MHSASVAQQLTRNFSYGGTSLCLIPQHGFTIVLAKVIITIYFSLQVSLSGAGDSRERIRRYHADYTFNSSCPSTQSTNGSQEKVSYLTNYNFEK